MKTMLVLLSTMGLAGTLAAGADGPLSAAKKAEVFEHDMIERFMVDGQVLCKLLLPTAERPFVAYNMPDNAYMTGMVLGAISMKHAVTKDAADRELAGQLLDGLNLLCTVSGKPGLLARAAWPVGREFFDDGAWRPGADGKHTWRGDVSSDQITGVIYGYAMAYDLVADEDQKAVIARNVAALVDHLLDNDLRIIGYDGKPTMWGRYEPEYVRQRERMNALLFLQHLKVAAHVTGAPRFSEAYRRYAVDEDYASVAVKARRLADPLSGRVNHSDDVLIFLAYYPLLQLETDEALRGKYLESLSRTWQGENGRPGVAGEANPFYTFTAKKFLGEDIDPAPAVATLERFPLDMKWNQNTIAGYETKFGFRFDPKPTSPEPEEGAPVPVDRRVKTWSAWVQDPYRSRGERTGDPGIEYNGHDYLIGYWLGRYLGDVSPDG